MQLGHVRRLVWVTLIAASLVAGVGVGVDGAMAKTVPEPSESDCDVITNLQLDSDAGSGYYGKTATNASKVFADAAEEIEDRPTKKSLEKLADVWEDVGKQKNVTAAAAVTVKAGKRYTKALSVYTEAHRLCFEQARDTVDDEDDSTSSNSTDDDSTSSTTEPEPDPGDE